MKRALPAFCVLLLLGCESAPPERDVFVPPYAQKGCWSRFYAEAGFGKPVRQYEGPIEVETMAPLFDDVQSLVLGPHAKLIGYEKPLFRDQSLFLAPAMSVTDARKVAFHDKVASFKVLCEAG